MKGRLLVLLLGTLAFSACVQDSADHKVPGEHGSVGALGEIRSALSVYYGDHAGKYPTDLSELTAGGRYLQTLPSVQGTPHPSTAEVAYYPSFSPKDTGRWGYVNEPGSKDFGTVWVDCTHPDPKGRPWHQF